MKDTENSNKNSNKFVIPISGSSEIHLNDTLEKINKLFSLETSFADYKETLHSLTAEEFYQIYQKTSGATLFHTLFSDESKIAKDKLNLLFQKALELKLDPNQKSFYQGLKNIPEFVDWDNSPLHHYIANERYDLALHFLAEATKNGFIIDLDAEDKEGKTPFLLAIKMGSAPMALIRALITKENYHQADQFGFTPAMMACATRQIEVMEELLKIHAQVSGITDFNVKHPSEKHKKVIAEFINQQHAETQKSLVHFALQRCGSDKDYNDKRGPKNQVTVLEIAASVGIDGRRDANAKCNAALNDTGAPVVMSGQEIKEIQKMTNTLDPHYPLYMRGVNNLLGGHIKKIDVPLDTFGKKTIYARMVYHGFKPEPTAMLASWENAFALLIELQGTNKDVHQDIPEQLKSYKQKSHIQVMMSRTPDMVNFLNKMGANFTLQQSTGNKTPKQYLDGLKDRANKEKTLSQDEKLITKEDLQYLIPLISRINNLEKQCSNNTTGKKNSLS